MAEAPAARLHDPVAHSHALGGFLAGAAVGLAAALGAAVVIGAVVGAVALEAGTAGLATPLVIGVVATVGEFGLNAVVGGKLMGMAEAAGEALGASSMGDPSGEIAAGSPNVRVNGLPAARATDAESCDAGKVAQGSLTVGINRLAAARVGDKTTCGAVIVQGSANVRIGGPTGTFAPIQSEVPAWARWAVVVASLLPALGGLARVVGPAIAEVEATGFARAAQTGVKALGRAMEGRAGGGAPEAAGEGSAPFLPKKMGETEPGAVPATPELQAQMKAASTRGAMSAPGYPDLPANEAQNFGDGVRPWNGDEQTGTISRVVGAESDPNGSYWQAGAPDTEADWRGSSAVKNDWNGDGGYVESNPQGLKGWIGPAAPQMSSDNVNVLPGGGEQIWIPKGSATPGDVKPTPWSGTS